MLVEAFFSFGWHEIGRFGGALSIREALSKIKTGAHYAPVLFRIQVTLDQLLSSASNWASCFMMRPFLRATLFLCRMPFTAALSKDLTAL